MTQIFICPELSVLPVVFQALPFLVHIHSQIAYLQLQSGRQASLPEGSLPHCLGGVFSWRLREHLQALWTYAHWAARSQEGHEHQVTMVKS